MSKRELLKTLHAGWRALGRPLKHGTLPPPLDKAEKFIKASVDLIAAFQSGELSPDQIARGDFDEHTLNVLETLGFASVQKSGPRGADN